MSYSGVVSGMIISDCIIAYVSHRMKKSIMLQRDCKMILLKVSPKKRCTLATKEPSARTITDLF
jgi:hypothetical protein